MKLYEAENIIRTIFTRSAQGIPTTLYDTPLVLPAEKNFTGHYEIADYIDTLIASPKIQSNYQPHPVCLRVRKGQNAAHYEPHKAIIAIPEKSWAMREIVILHEIAHHLHHEKKCRCLWQKEGKNTPQHLIPHGQDFLEAYLDLCQIVLGDQATFLFRTIFMEAGIWAKKKGTAR